MMLELTDKEAITLREALDSYLGELRSEIMKTDDRDWKMSLHVQEDTLREVFKRMN